jgi:hypothetical protein
MDEPEIKNAAHADVENYPLDEALIGLLADINQQILPLQAQRQGALVLFIRQQKLTGNWQVAENGRELVKVTAPAQVPTT